MIDENGVATLTGTIADPGTLDTFTLDINWAIRSTWYVQQYAFSASAVPAARRFSLTRQYRQRPSDGDAAG